ALREALGAAAVVDEEDRRGVLLDEAEQLRVHRGPDRPVGGLRVKRGLDRAGVDAVGRLRVGLHSRRWLARVAAAATLLDVRARLRHVLDRDDDLEVELLEDAGVDDLAVAPRADEE